MKKITMMFLIAFLITPNMIFAQMETERDMMTEDRIVEINGTSMQSENQDALSTDDMSEIMPMMGMMGQKNMSENNMGGMMEMMSMMNNGSMMGGLCLNWLIMLLVLLFLTLSIVALVRHILPKKSSVEPVNDALNILKVRYAKGDINQQEFVSMQKDLSTK